MNLSEYKNQLAEDPKASNGGTWYARSTVHHNGQEFKKGEQLPTDLTNGEVLALLDVNALTSVAPKDDASFVPPVHNGAPNQQGTVEGGVAHGNSQTVAPDSQVSGTTTEPAVDENGNPLDENGNPITQE